LFERAPARFIAFVALALAILFVRRPDQFLHPYVWVEEGTQTLPGYIVRGWLELFQPLSGYLVVTSKFIDVTAFQISILWTPQILAALAVALAIGVALAVALSPTHLRRPALCAFALLLVPTDSEVFAVAEYGFWWAGVLLPLALLWREERQWLRWLYLVVGGLSSPLIVPAAALLALRLGFERTRRELMAVALAIFVALIQIITMRSEGSIGTIISPDAWTIATLAQKFVGGFFRADAPLPGLLITAALLAAAWSLRARLDRYFLLLALMFGAVALTVSLRAPLIYLDPFTTGPRYFLYPFVLLAWLLVWLGAVAPRPLQLALGAAVAASLLICGPRLSRRHDAVDWRAHLLACAGSESYELPIHYIGRAAEMWHVKLTGAECRILLARSLF
jgi:hypothetical protein